MGLGFPRIDGPHEPDQPEADPYRCSLARRALDAVYRQPRVQGPPPDARRRRGCVLHRRRRQEDPRRPVRPVVHRARPWPPRDRRGGQPPGRHARLRPGVPVRPSPVVRARQQDQGAHPRRPRLRVLHLLGIRDGRHLAQDRARVLAREGPGHQDPADRPREGLPRRQLRRDLGRRHRRQPQGVRPGHRGRSPAAHPARGLRQGRRVHPRHAQARRRARRRSAAADRAARRVEHRRGDRRAVRGLGRRRDPAGRLPPAPARDLHREQHPADLRRGDHRLRPVRRVHRRGGVRRHPRYPQLRQAGHQRRPAARRGGGQEGDLRHLHGDRRSRVPGRALPRLHLLGPPDRVRRRRRGARSAGPGEGDRAGRRARPVLRERRPQAQGRQARHRHPQLRPRRRPHPRRRCPASPPSGRSRSR